MSLDTLRMSFLARKPAPIKGFGSPLSIYLAARCCLGAAEGKLGYFDQFGLDHVLHVSPSIIFERMLGFSVQKIYKLLSKPMRVVLLMDLSPIGVIGKHPKKIVDLAAQGFCGYYVTVQ